MKTTKKVQKESVNSGINFAEVFANISDVKEMQTIAQHMCHEIKVAYDARRAELGKPITEAERKKRYAKNAIAKAKKIAEYEAEQNSKTEAKKKSAPKSAEPKQDAVAKPKKKVAAKKSATQPEVTAAPAPEKKREYISQVRFSKLTKEQVEAMSLQWSAYTDKSMKLVGDARAISKELAKYGTWHSNQQIWTFSNKTAQIVQKKIAAAK